MRRLKVGLLIIMSKTASITLATAAGPRQCSLSSFVLMLLQSWPQLGREMWGVDISYVSAKVKLSLICVIQISYPNICDVWGREIGDWYKVCPSQRQIRPNKCNSNNKSKYMYIWGREVGINYVQTEERLHLICVIQITYSKHRWYVRNYVYIILRWLNVVAESAGRSGVRFPIESNQWRTKLVLGAS